MSKKYDKDEKKEEGVKSNSGSRFVIKYPGLSLFLSYIPLVLGLLFIPILYGLSTWEFLVFHGEMQDIDRMQGRISGTGVSEIFPTVIVLLFICRFLRIFWKWKFLKMMIALQNAILVLGLSYYYLESGILFSIEGIFVSIPLFFYTAATLGVKGNEVRDEKLKSNLDKDSDEMEEESDSFDVENDDNLIDVPEEMDKILMIEKLGLLLEKGILTKEEFTEEKRKVLSSKGKSTLQKKSHIQVKLKNHILVNQDKELTLKIRSNIDKIRKKFIKTYDEDLSKLIEEIFSEKDKDEINQYLSCYNEQYSEDLIEQIKNLTSSYDQMNKYLSPLIEKRIIEEKHPFNRST